MKHIKKMASLLLVFTVVISSVTVAFASDTENVEQTGDEVKITASEKPYLALGQDMSTEQRKTVLDLMGIDESKLDDYDVTYVNNGEEHKYLDSYISSKEIGTKSLSSVVITEAPRGQGLNISAYNINYCTVGMYKNACATAGVEDANIIVAGPFPISGTAALVGIFKAYQEMTGDTIDEKIVDAAMDELVTTGELNERIDADPEKVEALIADLKNQLDKLDTEDDMRNAIQETADKYDIALSDEDMDQIVKLLDKLNDLDLDWDSIADQASDWADALGDIDLDTEGILDTIIDFFKGLIEAIKNLFS